MNFSLTNSLTLWSWRWWVDNDYCYYCL